MLIIDIASDNGIWSSNRKRTDNVRAKLWAQMASQVVFALRSTRLVIRRQPKSLGNGVDVAPGGTTTNSCEEPFAIDSRAQRTSAVKLLCHRSHELVQVE